MSPRKKKPEEYLNPVGLLNQLREVRAILDFHALGKIVLDPDAALKLRNMIDRPIFDLERVTEDTAPMIAKIEQIQFRELEEGERRARGLDRLKEIQAEVDRKSEQSAGSGSKNPEETDPDIDSSGGQ